MALTKEEKSLLNGELPYDLTTLLQVKDEENDRFDIIGSWQTEEGSFVRETKDEIDARTSNDAYAEGATKNKVSVLTVQAWYPSNPYYWNILYGANLDITLGTPVVDHVDVMLLDRFLGSDGGQDLTGGILENASFSTTKYVDPTSISVTGPNDEVLAGGEGVDYITTGGLENGRKLITVPVGSSVYSSGFTSLKVTYTYTPYTNLKATLPAVATDKINTFRISDLARSSKNIKFLRYCEFPGYLISEINFVVGSPVAAEQAKPTQELIIESTKGTDVEWNYTPAT